jgi:hypothetical protein
MIEANLGIICACLIVLKQVVKGCFLSVLGRNGTSPKAGYDYGNGTGGTAGPATRSSKRETRKHFRLDDTVDDEDTLAPRRKPNDVYAWPDSKSHHLTSFAYRSVSEDGRPSDEKHIISTSGANRKSNQSSVDSVHGPSDWPLHQGITKKMDVHVESDHVLLVCSKR